MKEEREEYLQGGEVMKLKEEKNLKEEREGCLFQWRRRSSLS